MWYVGYQNISKGSSVQALIGPLTGSDGLELDYFDVNGAVTTDSSKVALIEIHVRAQTAQPVRSGGALGTLANKVDSISTRVALRNNPRDRKSTRLNSSHLVISYAVFCLKKKKKQN